MQKVEITKYIKNIITRIKERTFTEGLYIELKMKWPLLDNKSPNYKIDKSKFLKEICSLANAYGPEERYLIIGIDEETGELNNSSFNQSGLRDISDLSKLIVSSIKPDIRFAFEQVEIEPSKFVSVIQISNSPEKPFVMNENVTEKSIFPNFIAVRSAGGNINPASRDEIALMMYDNSNTQPEYALSVFPASIIGIQNFKNINGLPNNLTLTIGFENYGRKSILIKSGEIEIIKLGNNESVIGKKCTLHSYRYNESGDSTKHQHLDPIQLPANSVTAIRCTFQDVKDSPVIYALEPNIFEYIIKIVDFKGNEYVSGIFTRPINV
jgi:hypothetical protein